MSRFVLILTLIFVVGCDKTSKEKYYGTILDQDNNLENIVNIETEAESDFEKGETITNKVQSSKHIDSISRWKRDYIETVFTQGKIYTDEEVILIIKNNKLSYFVNGKLTEEHILIQNKKYSFPSFYFKDYPCDIIQHSSYKELIIIRDCYDGNHEYFSKI